MTDQSALSLFPSRVSIGTVQPDGRVIMSPEFFRALQKLFTQFQVVQSDEGGEIFASAFAVDYSQGGYGETVYQPAAQAESAQFLPEVFQPPNLAYELSLKQDLSGKDAANGYVGLGGYSINFKDATGTYTSTFSNNNTAARSYTFQDKSGTIADIADLTGGLYNFSAYTNFIAAGTPGITGTITLPATDISVVGGIIVGYTP